MSKRPAIVLSSLDLSRLESLMQSLPRTPELDQLEDELARARVVEPRKVPEDLVTMNSRVSFRITDSGREFEKVLCYPAEAGKVEQGLSVFTPVGTALLGLRVGQTIAWPLAGGKPPQQVEVTAVLYQPERAGEYQL